MTTNKHHIRNQPHCSEDKEYYNQNQQRVITNQHNNSWNIDQPDPINQSDLFEQYTQNKQTQQRRHNPTLYNKNFQNTKLSTSSNAKSNPITMLFTTTSNNKNTTCHFSQIPKTQTHYR